MEIEFLDQIQYNPAPIFTVSLSPTIEFEIST